MGATQDNSAKLTSSRLDLIACNPLTWDLVSALAGDRNILPAENLLLEHVKKQRGPLFFSDVLFVVTHQWFQEQYAEEIWNRILKHKYDLSAELRRNVKLGVAALDYLSNFTTAMESVTLITEADVWDIIRLSQHDGLTGLYNHVHFYNTLDAQMLYFTRYGANVSLLMLDIDDFKKLNDRYGHQEGDVVLSAIGTLLETTVRATDICCRYGGEEFAAILPMTSLKEAVLLAERIRMKLLTTPIEHRVTLSIGAASATKETQSSHDLVKKADDALYAAKNSGKNKVVATH